MNVSDTKLTDFEAQRSMLLGLSYRMLGSYSDAEDVVQDSWLRWQSAATEAVKSPAAFLTTTATRLCLDKLKSAHKQREVYFGPWLPEPLPANLADTFESGENRCSAEFASELSNAFLLALERLSPLERAAFILRDVFDLDFADIAETLERSEASCRKLASRARANVGEDRNRFAPQPERAEALLSAFFGALLEGNTKQLAQMLSEDVRLLSDGGGVVAAVGIPIAGRERSIKVMLGITKKYPIPADCEIRIVFVNGQIGAVVLNPDGSAMQTVALEFVREQISGIYMVRNPKKLGHIS